MKKLLTLLLFVPLFVQGQQAFYGTRQFVSLDGADTLELSYKQDTIFFSSTDSVYFDKLLFEGGGTAAAAGSDGEIQFNDGGVFGSDSNFTWNGTTLDATYNITDIYIGTYSGLNTTSRATNNVGVGVNTLRNIDGGDFNTAIGSNVLRNTTGSYNVGLGYNSGDAITNGANNTFLGSFSLSTNESGNNNTSIGYQSGNLTTGSGNVFIGYRAGYNETGSNKLYIENSYISTPLIYGEFDNDKVKINGYLDADSSVFEMQNLSAGRVKDLILTAADTWETIKLDTLYESVTTDSIRLNSDSTGVEFRFDGYCSFNGHATITNSQNELETAIIYLRVLLNDVEVSRFNTSKSRTFAANGTDDLTSYDGVFEVSKGDVVKVQIRTTNTDIILSGLNSGIFTHKTPFNIRLEQKLLNK